MCGGAADWAVRRMPGSAYSFTAALLVTCSLTSHGFCQPVTLQGRLQPLAPNSNPLQLPVVLSWPLSQTTVTFRGSNSITAVIANVSYTAPYHFEQLFQYVLFKSPGATQLSIAFQSGIARITLSGLSGVQQSATLTKIDESTQGSSKFFGCLVISNCVQDIETCLLAGSLAVIGFEIDNGAQCACSSATSVLS